jgi:hypothetical protein
MMEDCCECPGTSEGWAAISTLMFLVMVGIGAAVRGIWRFHSQDLSSLERTEVILSGVLYGLRYLHALVQIGSGIG